MVAAEIDMTLFAQRFHFGFEFDLKHPARSILSAKDSGMYKYKKGLKQPRTSVMYNAYDPPNPFTDFDLTGTVEPRLSGLFRIKQKIPAKRVRIIKMWIFFTHFDGV